MLTLDLTNATAALVATDFDALCDRIPEVHARIESGSDPRPGSAYLGWRHLPETLDPAEFARQIDCAARLREVAPRCVVAGIGGSYLGAKATIDALGSDQTIRFAGHHVDPEAVAELLAEIDDGDFTVVVISKSGTTTETALALGSIAGHAWMVDALVARLAATAAGGAAELLLTGGCATLLIPHLTSRHTYRPDLGLEGLATLAARLTGARDAPP
ncbi:MAG TPA: hypothetical protein DC005_09165 [Proteobacteria bacterium]|nr:hypothetical protein [Pseudomonadota bacterium]